jgi:DNA-binding IclR family transcriptional regulator
VSASVKLAARDGTAQPATRDSTVKSATRVLEVLEYFDRVHRAATVTEVARALKYPQSSTSVLIRSLVTLGYLEASPEDWRAYRPTARVTLLGAWIEPQLAAGGPVLQMMNELGEETGDLVILGMPQHGVVRYIHTVPATKPMRLHNAPGTIRPMATSGLGRLFMSTMDDERVREIVARHNASVEDPALQLTLAAVKRDLATIRAQGYAMSVDRVTPGAGVVAVLLAVSHGDAPLAVAIGGWSKSIKESCESYVQLMRKAIRRRLGDAGPRRGAVQGN